MVYLYQVAQQKLAKQQGMVLVVVMLMLLVMSLLAMSLFEVSIVETKMSAHLLQSLAHS